MLELADEADSKSVGSDTVRVRPPPPAPLKRIDPLGLVLFNFVYKGGEAERVCRNFVQSNLDFFVFADIMTLAFISEVRYEQICTN